jgi:hypothetical protein
LRRLNYVTPLGLTQLYLRLSWLYSLFNCLLVWLYFIAALCLRLINLLSKLCLRLFYGLLGLT